MQKEAQKGRQILCQALKKKHSSKKTPKLSQIRMTKVIVISSWDWLHHQQESSRCLKYFTSHKSQLTEIWLQKHWCHQTHEKQWPNDKDHCVLCAWAMLFHQLVVLRL